MRVVVRRFRLVHLSEGSNGGWTNGGSLLEEPTPVPRRPRCRALPHPPLPPMKTRTPRRYYHRHYVNVSTPRQEREMKEAGRSAGMWLATAAALTGVVFSVFYAMG